MKATLLLSAALCSLCLGTGMAQTEPGGREPEREKNSKSSREAKRSLVFGIKAGLNRSNVFDEEGLNFVADAKTGFVGGAFLAIPLGGFLGVQPELLVSQKGFQSTGRTNDGDVYWLERTSTYLDVPLQVQLKPFRFFSILGGIQYSYLMSQNDRLTFGNSSIEEHQDFRNDNIRKNILGLVTGFDINIRHLVLSGRASWDLRANRGDGSSYTPRYKNLLIQGTVGFRFY
jgi:hypothetical protein